MPLSGLQIYKLLPKTNCKECGFPTCLAFAMKLAAKQAELDDCPYVSEEAKAKLAAASRPPMRLITVGTGENKIEVGNETELFRHARTFYHEPGLMVRVKDTQPIEEIEETVSQVDSYSVELVGMTSEQPPASFLFRVSCRSLELSNLFQAYTRHKIRQRRATQ